MKTRILASYTALLLAAAAPLAAHADAPGEHPGYLHALSDLRAARWMIEHRPGDYAVASNEVAAVQQIDAAIRDIRHAAVDDGKDLDFHPPVSEVPDHAGRLHAADDFLRHARADVTGEEDNPTLHGMQHRSVEHIDGAIRRVDHAIGEATRGI